ncbi:hypothetical protein EVAR_8694_1 [Eumeta japonica]|uniref:Uncharacterized protein n=1 Tax=Eumeta variegata TaxID=151549 RepID=A0A4C1TVF8_EUMVA|nr:hypothetical protein EVAR_8694_1 [Eumeta japonica]
MSDDNSPVPLVLKCNAQIFAAVKLVTESIALARYKNPGEKKQTWGMRVALFADDSELQRFARYVVKFKA